MNPVNHFTDYPSCVTYLTTTLHKSAPAKLKDEASLQHSKVVMRAVGNPQDIVPAIHIAATSGKGSIAYGIDAILRAHSFTTTLLVSPHAYDIRERIQQNGSLISKQKFVTLASECLSALQEANIHPSYFEALMAMGFLAAHHLKSDYMVIETGLGGLWDTSNTITRQDKIAVIGSIGLDHTHILGETLTQIAQQKAGIMPHNGPAIVLEQSTEINAIFNRIATERNTTLTWVKPGTSSYKTNWLMANKALSIMATRDGWHYDNDLANVALRSLHIPARFEIRQLGDRLVILDAAHNPQKTAALVAWLGHEYPQNRFTTILSVSSSKDAEAIIATLNPVVQQYVVTAFSTDQQDLPIHAIPIDDLATIATKRSVNMNVHKQPDAQSALTYVLEHTKGPVLITGSFYIVGEVGNLLDRL